MWKDVGGGGRRIAGNSDERRTTTRGDEQSIGGRGSSQRTASGKDGQRMAAEGVASVDRSRMIGDLPVMLGCGLLNGLNWPKTHDFG